MKGSYIKGVSVGIYIGAFLVVIGSIGAALVVNARGGHEGGDHDGGARETGCGGTPCPAGFINHPTWEGNKAAGWDLWAQWNVNHPNHNMLFDDFSRKYVEYTTAHHVQPRLAPVVRAPVMGPALPPGGGAAAMHRHPAVVVASVRRPPVAVPLPTPRTQNPLAEAALAVRSMLR